MPEPRLLGYARQVLQALTDADRAMTALQGHDGGRVTIGLVTTASVFRTACAGALPGAGPASIALQARRRQPGTQILALMGKGQVDLAVMGQPPDELRCRGGALRGSSVSHHRRTGPSGSPGSRPPRRRRPRRATPFVLREDGSGTRALMERFFPGLGLKPRVGMVSSSNETIKQAVMAGMGLALISRHTIRPRACPSAASSILPVEGFPLMRSWFVGHRRTLQLLPAHQRLRAFLIEEGARIIAALETDDRGSRPAAAAGPAVKPPPEGVPRASPRPRRPGAAG